MVICQKSDISQEEQKEFAINFIKHREEKKEKNEKVKEEK